MNADPENFEDLKKLLALKRHEKPPPRYFDDLSRQVWRRIEAEEAEPSFWRRIFPKTALRPSVAYAFGLIVCATLIVGIGSALKQPEAPVAHPMVTQDQTLAPLVPIAPALAQENATSNQGNESSTNPVINPTINVQPVNFSPQ